MYCLRLLRGSLTTIAVLCACIQLASAAVVRVDTAEMGNKLNLVEIEVTSGAGTGNPNRVFPFAELIPATVSNYVSVPENNAANTITVLGTPDVAAPTGSDRLLLLGDPHLNTGIFNPSTSTPGVQVTFDRPLVNGPGEDLVIFELTIGTGQTPDPLKVRQVGGVGSERNVPSSHYQMQGVIPTSGFPNTFLSTVENGGTTDFAELQATELANFGAVTNAKWHIVPIDLDWLGVPTWQSIADVEIVSGDGSRAADLLGVFGLLPITLPGDYDLDGDVDGRDFLIWQQQYGVTGTSPADGNHDGTVDGVDLSLWQDYYGFSSLSGIRALPEPKTCLFSLTIALGIVFRPVRLRVKHGE